MQPQELPPREREVLALAAEGLTTAQIARRLCVERTSIDTYFSRIYKRLGVRHPRAQAIYLYRQEAA